MNLGTTNKLMPLLPAGASGNRANTKWMMFSARSCSPALMKILAPVILKLPSACGSALVRSSPKSVPQWASVRHMVPVHCPLVILGKYICF